MRNGPNRSGPVGESTRVYGACPGPRLAHWRIAAESRTRGNRRSCTVQASPPAGEGITLGPQRVLIVSANMGEGHNATGRALDQAVRARWPGVTVEWLDTLDAMGRGVGPVFRGIYVTNVRRTPWLYEFFYHAIQRYRWFARASKRFVGAWCGRRMAGHVARFRPDLILCTYPLGSCGLAWLRRHRDLRTPMGAWVSDFSPHPFWVHAELDLNLVMH